MYRWGIYHGDELLTAARRIYFDRFRTQLLNNTQANLVTYLGALPATPEPTADYDAAYAPLRAYLITTTNADKSTPEFLAPVLMQYWQGALTPSSDQQKQLARRQFDFYAGELRHENPYSIAPAMPAVTHARTYLSNFGGFERIYQSILTAANKLSPSIDFNRLYPRSAETVVETHVVAGAFTKPGFAFVQDALKHPDRYFSGEAWVLGDQAPPSLDRANLTQQLTTRYLTDYLAQWHTFLQSASVVRYRNLPDAAAKLTVLAGNNSPLLALIYTVSHNTAVASPQIADVFQPAQSLVPPESVDRYIAPGNTPYVTGLLSLQGSVAQVAQNPAGAADPAAAMPIISAATSAHMAARQTAQAFRIDPTGHTDARVLSLMEDPITSTEALVRGLGPAQANGGGKSFCAAYNQTFAKFPFTPTSAVQATPAEIAALLQPGTGSLWQFYNANLKALLIPLGAQYGPAPNAPMQVTAGFTRFFNRLVSLSNDFFPAGATSPSLNFMLRNVPTKGIQNATLTVDGQQLTGSGAAKQFTWNSQTAQQAQLTASYSGAKNMPCTGACVTAWRHSADSFPSARVMAAAPFSSRSSHDRGRLASTRGRRSRVADRRRRHSSVTDSGRGIRLGHIRGVGRCAGRAAGVGSGAFLSIVGAPSWQRAGGLGRFNPVVLAMQLAALGALVTCGSLGLVRAAAESPRADRVRVRRGVDGAVPPGESQRCAGGEEPGLAARSDVRPVRDPSAHSRAPRRRERTTRSLAIAAVYAITAAAAIGRAITYDPFFVLDCQPICTRGDNVFLLAVDIPLGNQLLRLADLVAVGAGIGLGVWGLVRSARERRNRSFRAVALAAIALGLSIAWIPLSMSGSFGAVSGLVA